MSFVIKNIHLSIKRSIFPRIRKKIIRKDARPKKVVLFPEIGRVIFLITYPPAQVKCVSEYICFVSKEQTHTNRKNYTSKFIHTILRFLPSKN